MIIYDKAAIGKIAALSFLTHRLLYQSSPSIIISSGAVVIFSQPRSVIT